MNFFSRSPKGRYEEMKYSLHSFRVKGFTKILEVTLSYRPPLLDSISSAIQEVALPHTISFTCFLDRHQSLQKCSNADKKVERGLSIQGSSSMKTTCFPPVYLRSRSSCNKWNASCHVFGQGTPALFGHKDIKAPSFGQIKNFIRPNSLGTVLIWPNKIKNIREDIC